MWVVIYGRHWTYVEYKEDRYETPYLILALLVYWQFYFRYVLTMLPVKYIKMYKVQKNVVYMKNYWSDYRGRDGNEQARGRRR